MKLRRFTDAGVAKTRAFLAAVKEENNVDAVMLDGKPFTRATLLSSPAYSEAIPALADIDLDETRTFDTTFAFCEYFDSLIHDHNPQAYREDVGFWTWLAMVYLPQLVKTKGGKVSAGENSKVVYSPENYQRQYGHLLGGPFYLYFYYRNSPEICKAVTWHKLNVFPDIAEQIASRYDFVHNPAFLSIACALYYDEGKQTIRRGAGGKGAGSPRHLVSVVDQLAMTHDFFNKEDSVSLYKILPEQFHGNFGIIQDGEVEIPE